MSKFVLRLTQDSRMDPLVAAYLALGFSSFTVATKLIKQENETYFRMTDAR